MALDAGYVSVTLEFAKGLKDKDMFGRQDPYCIMRVGGQTRRSKTAKDGGRDPVWGETFQFTILHENNIDLEIKDEDVGRDDLIGTATVSLARARQTGHDRMQVPVMSKNGRKQHGFISVSLSWKPNRVSSAPHPQAQATPNAVHDTMMPPLPYMPLPYHAILAAPPPPVPPATVAAPGYHAAPRLYPVTTHPTAPPLPSPPPPTPPPAGHIASYYYPAVPYPPWPQANPYPAIAPPPCQAPPVAAPSYR